MAPSIVAVLAIGGLLGLRHAFEPDHLAAVSTLATRPTARLWSAARLGLVWGLGHTVTVGAVALLIIALGVRLPDRFWPAAELLVATLLVLLGSVVIWRYTRGRWHMHMHAHVAASPHFHLHSHASSPDHGHSHTGGDARRSLGDDSACRSSRRERRSGRDTRPAGDCDALIRLCRLGRPPLPAARSPGQTQQSLSRSANGPFHVARRGVVAAAVLPERSRIR